MGVLYLLAAKIGDSFGQSLKIFSVFIWMIAGGLFAYLILFRGMKFTIFGSAKQLQIEDEFDDVDEASVDEQREALDASSPPSAT